MKKYKFKIYLNLNNIQNHLHLFECTSPLYYLKLEWQVRPVVSHHVLVIICYWFEYESFILRISKIRIAKYKES